MAASYLNRAGTRAATWLRLDTMRLNAQADLFAALRDTMTNAAA